MPTPETAPTRSARLVRALTFSTLTGIVVACGGGGDSPTSPGNTNTTGSQVITNVSIGGNTTSVAVGATVQLSAAARNAAGTTVGATFAWSSNNSAVATVGSSTGVVTGVAVGNATITASASGFSGTRVISVTNAGGGGGPPPLSAQIDMPGTAFEPGAVTIGVGGTITWVFTSIAHDVLFGAGAGVQDMPLTVNATVSRTFNTKGTFSITCTAHTGMTGSITVQ